MKAQFHITNCSECLPGGGVINGNLCSIFFDTSADIFAQSVDSIWNGLVWLS